MGRGGDEERGAGRGEDGGERGGERGGKKGEGNGEGGEGGEVREREATTVRVFLSLVSKTTDCLAAVRANLRCSGELTTLGLIAVYGLRWFSSINPSLNCASSSRRTARSTSVVLMSFCWTASASAPKLMHPLGVFLSLHPPPRDRSTPARMASLAASGWFAAQ